MSKPVRGGVSFIIGLSGVAWLIGGLLVSVAPTHAQRHWQGPPPHNGVGRDGWKPPTPEERERARIQIGMSVAQQAQIQALFASSDQKRRELGNQIRDLSRKHRAVFEAYSYNRGQEKQLRQKMERLHIQMLQIRLDTEDGLRRILTHPQFDKMRALMKAHRRETPSGFRPPAGESGTRTD